MKLQHKMGLLRRLKRRREEARNPGIEIKPRRARVIGLFSCKGGVGKTTTAVNFSTVLAEKLPGRVLVVDTNISAPNLGQHLGILEPKATIHDVIAGELKIENSVQTFEGGLHALLGSVAFGEEAAPIDLRGLLEPLMHKYTAIILDTAPGLGAEVIAAMKASDEIVAITNPHIPTIVSTLKTFRAAERYRVPITGVVVNKVLKKRYEIPMKEVEKTLGWPVLAAVPEDEKVPESLWAGVPVVCHAPKSKAARKFNELGELFFARLTGRREKLKLAT